ASAYSSGVTRRFASCSDSSAPAQSTSNSDSVAITINLNSPPRCTTARPVLPSVPNIGAHSWKFRRSKLIVADFGPAQLLAIRPDGRQALRGDAVRVSHRYRPRRLPARVFTRRGGHGRRLPGRGGGQRAQGRADAPRPRARPRPALSRALPARVEGGDEARPPAHRPDARRGRGGRR